MDDYFAECDEHLATVRRLLLDLERSATPRAGAAGRDRGAVPQLSFASRACRAWSACARRRSLAHHMESYLRALRGRDAPADRGGRRRAGRRCRCPRARHRGAPRPADGAGHRRRSSRAWSRSAATADTAGAAAVPGAAAGSTGAGGATGASRSCRPRRCSRAASTSIPCGRGCATPARSWTPHPGSSRAASRSSSCSPARSATTRSRPGATPGWPWTPRRRAARPARRRAAAVRRHCRRRSAPSHVVRVDLTRLDDLMRMIGELVISRARLEASAREGRAPRAARGVARRAGEHADDRTPAARSARRGHARAPGPGRRDASGACRSWSAI